MNKTKLKKGINATFIVGEYVAVVILFMLFGKWTRIDLAYLVFCVSLLNLIAFFVISIISLIQLRKNKEDL